MEKTEKSTDLDLVLQELLNGNEILVNEGVIDGFGHISVRHPTKPDHYFMIQNNAAPTLENGVLELDVDSNPVNPQNARASIERFIHGEIYRSRPEVNSVVHTHSPALIPFGVSKTPLRPLYHICGFLGSGAPVFDIAKEHGETNMLITNPKLGQSLVRSLDKSAVVLMRGHGATVVGSSIQEAVFRAVYTQKNAQLQPIAMQMGEVNYLSSEEAKLADELHGHVLGRPWNFWLEKLKS